MCPLLFRQSWRANRLLLAFVRPRNVSVSMFLALKFWIRNSKPHSVNIVLTNVSIMKMKKYPTNPRVEFSSLNERSSSVHIYMLCYHILVGQVILVLGELGHLATQKCWRLPNVRSPLSTRKMFCRDRLMTQRFSYYIRGTEQYVHDNVWNINDDDNNRGTLPEM